jgi:hypothetical protein
VTLSRAHVQPLLYGELVPWYRLLDPPADHLDEATSYREALERAAGPGAETLLELGAGAGHNAFYLKDRFRCTLTDIAEPCRRSAARSTRAASTCSAICARCGSGARSTRC